MNRGRGNAVYTPLTLRFYDWTVLRISNRWLWKCPTGHLVRHYQDHVTGNHLDVGVGTGFYPDRCAFPAARPRLALLDANTHCLTVAATRVRRYRPLTHRADILHPVEWSVPQFDSIALMYVLHCLPGRMDEKGRVFDHLCRLLVPGGKVFGATLLGSSPGMTVAARLLMKSYNAVGIFANERDSASVLEKELAKRFASYAVRVVGCAALFEGRRDANPS